MNSQALEYYQVLRSHTKQDHKHHFLQCPGKDLASDGTQCEAPSEELNVFFRTTSLTPSRPDIAKTRPRLCEGRWGDRSCYYFLGYDECYCCCWLRPACIS